MRPRRKKTKVSHLYTKKTSIYLNVSENEVTGAAILNILIDFVESHSPN